MITQISFTADKNLKNKALDKAKSEGITLKALLIYAMKSFVEDKISFGLETIDREPDVEEVVFTDPAINQKAAKLAQLLK